MTDDEILASCNVPWYFIGEKLRQSQGLNQLQRMKKKLPMVRIYYISMPKNV